MHSMQPVHAGVVRLGTPLRVLCEFGHTAGMRTPRLSRQAWPCKPSQPPLVRFGKGRYRSVYPAAGLAALFAARCVGAILHRVAAARAAISIWRFFLRPEIARRSRRLRRKNPTTPPFAGGNANPCKRKQTCKNIEFRGGFGLCFGRQPNIRTNNAPRNDPRSSVS